MKKNIFLLIITLFTSLALFSCGEGKVDITDAKYEPKLVISGYIFPGQNVERITIMRNVPLNANVNLSEIVLSKANVNITDVASGISYKLDFDQATQTFKYNGTALVIKCGASYKLDVSAVVDGKTLNASSVTTVPKSGFALMQKDLGEYVYHAKDANGVLQKINFDFKPSSDAKFYGVSLVAQNGSYSNFIKDNVYFEIKDSNDVIKNLDSYSKQFYWIQDVNSAADKINMKVEWIDVWFYGKYRLIVYAGDKNFMDFAISNENLQEMDGNFHAPILNITGDGIGIFGSAIPDTLWFSVK